MSSTTTVSADREVWLVYLSCRRPEAGLVARVELADVPRRSILTVVAGDHDSTIRLLEPQNVPAGKLAAVRERDADATATALMEVLAAAPGQVVLAAVDRVGQLAARDVVNELDHVVAVSTLDAALRLVAMVKAGAQVDEVLYPPGFSVDLSVADAGIGPAACSETLVTVDHGPLPPDASWLTVKGRDLAVNTHGMTQLDLRAVTSRVGRRRRVIEDAPRRLLLGPANFAGQGGEWARSVREHAPGWAARNMHVVTPGAPLVFGADLPLTTVEWAQPATRLDLAVELVVGATDIVVEAMRPILGVGDGSDAANSTDTRRAMEDVDALRASGRNVALLFHGSEVRRPRDHVRLTPWSPFYQAQTHVLTASLEQKTELVHEAIAGFDGPVLVSTLDLLDHVPGAVWLPIVVGPASFLPVAAALTGRRLVVAHAPSSSWLKGSEWVDPVLQRMERQGLLTYRRIQNLPPIMVPSLLQEVDVVVDQVVLSNPGVLAAQAMAAGRLVLAHLTEPVRRRFPDPPPVVETTPETIEQVLLSVIENPEHYAQIAARGVAFARKYHDGRMSARVLTEVLS